MVRPSLCAAALALFALFPVVACSSSSSTNDERNPDGGLLCGSCAEVYVNGGVACGPGDSSDAWQALATCACGKGPCASACAPTFCAILPADETCGSCLMTSCSPQEGRCAAN